MTTAHLSPIEQASRYFRTHQDDIVREYQGKYVLIHDDQVLGAFDNVGEAYQEAVSTLAPGTYVIQHAIPGEAAYTQSFRSRARFA